MSDLIKRSDAIEAIEGVDWYHQNRNKDMVSGANDDEHQAWYKADDIYRVLETIPSAMPKEHTCEYCHYEYIDARKYPCSICACAERRMDMFQPKGAEREDIKRPKKRPRYIWPARAIRKAKHSGKE